jgi:hypothetical protein
MEDDTELPALEDIKMEYCTRCKERWFDMRLRGGVRHNCFNRDEKKKGPQRG